ncbi:hypothetical protein BKA83DRAFT_1985896 [Pisolithus microcarpus]|nr:hypothetical protein BKA83DRAFT_1985896 [Pisolithus microcarpus]
MAAGTMVDFCAPPVVIPPDPFAGGRSTNGKVWVEHLAKESELHSWTMYAVTITTLWPDNPCPREVLHHANDDFSHSHTTLTQKQRFVPYFLASSQPASDWEDSFLGRNHLPQAAEDLLGQIALLSKPPTNAREFLIT